MQNLDNLSLGQDHILPNILGDTQVITRYLRLFNRYLISPVIRSRDSDRLSLKFLNWLHAAHPQTQHIPAAFSDGSFASWSDLRFPTIYFMPPSAQRRLLYLALFFHEFGHLLYACHQQEMDALVESLQKTISEHLEPIAQRDDAHAKKEQERRSVIVETWFEWTHEIFCDAVGLVIGGPAFAHSFSLYFRMLGRREYHLRPEYLAGREHPVTWLRIRLIADRARRMGFSDVAASLESSWFTIAKQMSVTEDYYGFYVPEFLPAIQQTVDDMLEEASPRHFEDHEVDTSEQDIRLMSPVKLVNQAWHQFYRDTAVYSGWERNVINIWLGTN
ncbi:MAG: hypothetical protein L0229_30910 [Blastocatellia bacterium]|nr:hypothetical protein [Blastocatellia bacterium]